MPTTLNLLSSTYLNLLQLKPSSRYLLQPALANLRDIIAELGGFEPQDVQESFELVAACTSEAN